MWKVVMCDLYMKKKKCHVQFFVSTCDKAKHTWKFIIRIRNVDMFIHIWKNMSSPVFSFHIQSLVHMLKYPSVCENVEVTYEEAHFTWFYVPQFVSTCESYYPHATKNKSQTHTSFICNSHNLNENCKM